MVRRMGACFFRFDRALFILTMAKIKIVRAGGANMVTGEMRMPARAQVIAMTKPYIAIWNLRSTNTDFTFQVRSLGASRTGMYLIFVVAKFFCMAGLSV